ncbi:MAG TPA: methyltransferase domain-containing protein [Propionibacteriaceae bacterium]|nr:methyltransferase domain-containing protein [Propionibacteriaceae bacterium]
MTDSVEAAPNPGLQFLAKGFRVSAQDDASVRKMLTLLDMQDAAPSIRRLRDWALGLAQPQPGERVIDVGSGSGTMARELAGLVVPGGSVTGVEPNPMLRAIADARAKETGSTASFVDGFADALPFDDYSVDLIWCERVLQHLDDAQAAINDFARVLRAGGRAVLLDSDHASRVTSDVDPEVEAAVLDAFLRETPNPRAARLIPRQVLTAGLVLDPDIGASALVLPHAVMGQSLVDISIDKALSTGAISREQGDQARQSLLAAVEAGYAFSAVTVFGFLARKPEATDNVEP